METKHQATLRLRNIALSRRIIERRGSSYRITDKFLKGVGDRLPLVANEPDVKSVQGRVAAATLLTVCDLLNGPTEKELAEMLTFVYACYRASGLPYRLPRSFK